MPEGTWNCYEWHYDQPNNKMELWLDGAQMSLLTVNGTGMGCINNGLGGEGEGDSAAVAAAKDWSDTLAVLAADAATQGRRRKASNRWGPSAYYGSDAVVRNLCCHYETFVHLKRLIERPLCRLVPWQFG